MARESRETWTKRVERWAESGLTAKEFAAEVGVNSATLMHWKYRLAAEARGASTLSAEPKQDAVSFVEVQATAPDIEPARKTSPPPAFELVFASGATVRIPAGFDAATLRRLLDVMTRR
jgi:hypothetical protein